jgi:hypothetical protein
MHGMDYMYCILVSRIFTQPGETMRHTYDYTVLPGKAVILFFTLVSRTVQLHNGGS